jgi:hypothetical protein
MSQLFDPCSIPRCPNTAITPRVHGYLLCEECGLEYENDPDGLKTLLASKHQLHIYEKNNDEENRTGPAAG